MMNLLRRLLAGLLGAILFPTVKLVKFIASIPITAILLLNILYHEVRDIFRTGQIGNGLFNLVFTLCALFFICFALPDLLTIYPVVFIVNAVIGFVIGFKGQHQAVFSDCQSVVKSIEKDFKAAIFGMNLSHVRLMKAVREYGLFKDCFFFLGANSLGDSYEDYNALVERAFAAQATAAAAAVNTNSIDLSSTEFNAIKNAMSLLTEIEIKRLIVCSDENIKRQLVGYRTLNERLKNDYCFFLLDRPDPAHTVLLVKQYWSLQFWRVQWLPVPQSSCIFDKSSLDRWLRFNLDPKHPVSDRDSLMEPIFFGWHWTRYVVHPFYVDPNNLEAGVVSQELNAMALKLRRYLAQHPELIAVEPDDEAPPVIGPIVTPTVSPVIASVDVLSRQSTVSHVWCSIFSPMTLVPANIQATVNNDSANRVC